MQITDTEQQYIVTRSPDTTADELARLMDQQHVGCVVITENDEPVGMVTDRDLAVKLVQHDKRGSEVSAREIMTDKVITADYQENIFQLIRKMESNVIRRLPITKDGKVVNIVTMDDLNRLLVKELGLLNRIAEAGSPFRVIRDLFEFE